MAEMPCTAVTGIVGVNIHEVKGKENHRAKESWASPEIRVRKQDTFLFFVFFVLHLYFMFSL